MATVTIDWGDGSAVQQLDVTPVGETESWTISGVTHTYATPGSRTITVTGPKGGVDTEQFTAQAKIAAISPSVAAPAAAQGPFAVTGEGLGAPINEWRFVNAPGDTPAFSILATPSGQSASGVTLSNVDLSTVATGRQVDLVARASGVDQARLSSALTLITPVPVETVDVTTSVVGLEVHLSATGDFT